MNQLQVIENQGQRVLFTSQLAESYGTDKDRISANFKENERRFVIGKHFYLLQGDELKRFKNEPVNSGLVSKNTSHLYLWTEKGAFLHAKSLNTDEAWAVYDELVESYFHKVEVLSQLNNLSPQLQALIHIEMEQNKLKAEVNEVKAEIETIKDTFLQKDEDWRKSINQMINNAVKNLDVDYPELKRRSYKSLEERAKCKLEQRLANLKNRLAGSGATKTRINQTNKLDVIESDARLKEIYTTIVKELSIGSLSKKG